jgi:HAE1 family hydrophobic/amphiphilic exporter-1
MLWLWNFFLDRRQFSYVLLAALIAAGLFTVAVIPKENTPSIDIAEAVVTTALPGASAADMETLVTDKLEDQISNISNIDTVTSDSSDGISEITVQFTANADINQSTQDLRDAVSKAVPDLPSDATTPQVTKVDFTDQPIIVASIASDLPPSEFSALGTTVSDDLKNVPGVSEVDIAGVPPRQVSVVVNKSALLQYGLTLTGIIADISASNAALPAGSISSNNINYDVNFQGGITDPSQIADIAVTSKNGIPIYLRDIAVISDGLAPASTYSRLSIAGKPSEQAITLSIYHQSGTSIQGVSDAVKAEFAALQKTDLKGMTVLISPSTDQGVQVTKQLGTLAETGVETVILVIIVLLLTIGWRESLVAALAIPISFLIAFIGLYLTGQTLNFISLFALILAVGILVDSGIVVTEAIHTRVKIYGDAEAAARAALHDYAWPLIAGTMATVAVFAPLFFISGIIGKFIAGIPYTLIFVLLASIFVALGIVPMIAILLTGGKEHNPLEMTQERYTNNVTQWYKRQLRRILEHRQFQNYFIIGLVVLFILAIALPISGIVPSVFFPQSDEDFVYINIQTPEGTTLGATDLVTREAEDILYTDPDISSFVTTVGESSGLTGAGSSGSNNANITVNLPDGHKKSSTEVASELLSKLSGITGASFQVIQANNGPSSGAPIEIQFTSNNLDEILTAASQAKQLLSTIQGATDITSSADNNGTEIDLTIDRAKAAAAGLTTQEIAQTLRAAINGAKATSITEPDQDIDVDVMLNLNPDYTTPDTSNVTTIDAIENLSIEGPNGPVLLGSVLSSSLAESNADISHKDKLRIETVSAYPDAKTTAGQVVSAFQARIGELHLPSDVAVSYGGDNQQINQSFTQMFIALIAGLLFMFMILIIASNSIRYTLYLLSIVPLSLIGVLGGLALIGQPLSFTSILGIIALGGVIINHAIILLDSMIHHLAEDPDKPVIDVVIDSAAMRLRPIVLTTITTVIGMIPLALSNATWGPLAFSVMFGLTFAICLTLVLVPVLFFRAPHNRKKQ